MEIETVRSLLGIDFSAGQYKVVAHNLNTLPAANTVFIPQARADSVDSGAFTTAVRINFATIQIVDYANRVELAGQLRARLKAGSTGTLVAASQEDGLDYQLNERVANLIPPEPGKPDLLYTVILHSGQTAWRAVDAESDLTWSPTGLGGTHVITVGGTDETRLSLSLTGTNAPTGVFVHQNRIQLLNVPGVNFGFHTFCITLDTETLIDEEKMQDGCEDLRLYDHGVEINRWVENPYTTATLVFFNLVLSPGQALPLFGGTAQVETATATGTITGSGNATVTVTAAGMTGSPKAISVPVINGNLPARWANKVRAKLRLDPDVTAMFTVSGAGRKIVLVRKAPAANDATLNIALANGTCTGITAAPTSANTTAGVLYGIASSGAVPSLAFSPTPAVRAAIAALPAQTMLVHGTERFVVRKTATSLIDCILEVVTRGAHGTTMQAHNGGDIFNFLEHDLVMKYGNNAVGDPTLAAGYNNTKPVGLLSSSNWTGVVYTAASLFYDPAYPSRPWSWTPFIQARQGPGSYPYAFKGVAASGDPALGVRAAAFLQGAAWRADQVIVGWQMYEPGGIRRITCTGRKYRTDTTWPTAKLECSADGATWTPIFTEATPASPGGFEALATHTDIDLPAGQVLLRWTLTGVSSSAANAYELLEALTFIVYFTTANIPTATFLGEQTNFHMDIRLRNTATLGDLTITDAIELRYPARLDTPLILNGETYEATYDGTNVHGAMKLDDESRTVWIRALPGVVNTLSIESLDGESIGTMDVVPSLYRRRL